MTGFLIGLVSGILITTTFFMWALITERIHVVEIKRADFEEDT